MGMAGRWKFSTTLDCHSEQPNLLGQVETEMTKESPY
jgi:hypothetical protein